MIVILYSSNKKIYWRSKFFLNKIFHFLINKHDWLKNNFSILNFFFLLFFAKFAKVNKQQKTIKSWIYSHVCGTILKKEKLHFFSSSSLTRLLRKNIFSSIGLRGKYFCFRIQFFLAYIFTISFFFYFNNESKKKR